jgi:hypothetical protein
MNYQQKAALLTELIDRLRANGNVCEHRHVQMAAYFLQDLFDLPTGYEYLLYKNSPFSFDLEEDLTALRAHYLIEFDFRSLGYGAGLEPTQTSAELRARHPATLGRYARQIDFVARTFGPMDLAHLVRLATAFYVTRELGEAADDVRRANRLKELKPFLSTDDALNVLHEFDRIAADAKSLAVEATPV